MNTLIVGLGQGGTTIASMVSELLLEKTSNDAFINPNGISCKCFLIDSESKVLNNFLKSKSPLSKFFSKYTNIITNASGRGNNWALGHSMQFKEFKTEKNINQDSYDHLQSFIEKCDFINRIMFIHSLNGGTGSGCGSRLIEMLRDDFKKIRIISSPIFGFDIENTTLSQFNTFFTLGTIYDHVDLIFRIENEKYKKDFSYSNAIISNLIADYLIRGDDWGFNIDKCYRRNKFVNFNSLEFDYIHNYGMITKDKVDNLIFGNEKGKIGVMDVVYKTNSKNNKDYLKFNEVICKKCKVFTCNYAQEKKMKMNQMNIGVYYKSDNIQWMNEMVNNISKKIRQR